MAGGTASCPDYTFAVIDDRPDAPEGRLVNIGKAYSGLTDVEIAEMTRWFEAHTVSHARTLPGRGAPRSSWRSLSTWCTVSSRHASGFALRFPRIVRIRDDKDALRGRPTEHGGGASMSSCKVGGRYGVLTRGATVRHER